MTLENLSNSRNKNYIITSILLSKLLILPSAVFVFILTPLLDGHIYDNLRCHPAPFDNSGFAHIALTFFSFSSYFELPYSNICAAGVMHGSATGFIISGLHVFLKYRPTHSLLSHESVSCRPSTILATF